MAKNSKSNTGKIAGDREVPLASIFVRPTWNTRQVEDAEEAMELRGSIATDGLLTPLLVIPLPCSFLPESEKALKDGFSYVLVSGHRRYVAVSELKWESVEVTLFKGTTAGSARKANILENVQRCNLHPLDEAEALEKYRAEEGITSAEALCKAVGKWTKQHMTPILKVATSLAPEIKTEWRLKPNGLHMEKAKELAAIEGVEAQVAAFEEWKKAHPDGATRGARTPRGNGPRPPSDKKIAQALEAVKPEHYPEKSEEWLSGVKDALAWVATGVGLPAPKPLEKSA